MARKTAERQLRAYLGVRTSKVVSHDGGSTFIVEIEIINTGQTPARRVTHSIAAELQVLHGSPLNFQIPATQPGEWFMAPNTSFTFVQDIAMGGPSGTGTIDIGQRTIFTWGRIDFIDAFDQAQHIEFRYRNDRPIRQHDGTVMRTVGWELEPCDEGNTCTPKGRRPVSATTAVRNDDVEVPVSPDHPPEPVIVLAGGETRWRMMTSTGVVMAHATFSSRIFTASSRSTEWIASLRSQ